MRILPIVIALAVLVVPASALADAFDDVFEDYQRDGRISACRHTDETLRDARRQIPNDIEQYAPDFPDALDDALERRARGECDNGGRRGDGSPNGVPEAAGGAPGDPQNPTGTTAQTTPGAAPAPPGSAQASAEALDQEIVNAANREADAGGDAPAPLLVLAVVGGLLALVALVWGLMRWLAVEPGWLAGARHATAEAGWRTSGFWADFADWIRRGNTRPAK
jgi:hypothetical protein